MPSPPLSLDLTSEKKLAKALLRACRKSDAAALARIKAQMPRLDPAKMALADAQLVIAREKGFPSWPKMKAAAEAAQPIERVAELFLDAVRDDRSAVARRLLAAHPALATFSIHTAAAAADPEALAAWLDKDPKQVVAVHGDQAWPPLAYACRSRMHRASPSHAARQLDAVTRLLAAGAGANSGSRWREGDQGFPIPVLYHACMGDHLGIVRLLLEHGAQTQDGESVYHAAQLDRRACLAELVAHGADISARHPPYDNTPLYFLVGHHSDEGGTATWFRGLTWLLEHGADPNVTSYDHRETPLHAVARGPHRLATARQLLAHGADPHLPRADGRTPYALALRHGNLPLVELLAEIGAATEDVAPIDAFLGACLAADGERARAILAAHPGLVTNLTVADREALADAVRWDNAEALRLLVELGFQLSWESRDGGTPLHYAAWLGRRGLVDLLLELGAPINQRDSQFGCSPLGWAAHGSNQHRHDEVYCAIVDRLVDSGATLEAAINRWGGEPAAMASRRVKRRLKERGMVRAA